MLGSVARYLIASGLAAIVLGVGALNWLPLMSVVLGACFVFYVVTRVDFRFLVQVLMMVTRLR